MRKIRTWVSRVEYDQLAKAQNQHKEGHINEAKRHIKVRTHHIKGFDYLWAYVGGHFEALKALSSGKNVSISTVGRGSDYQMYQK